MRIAIVTESFLPQLNGVTTSVCKVTEALVRSGHQVTIIAPAPAPHRYAGAKVHALASIPVREFPVGLPTKDIERILRREKPDVVHIASPFVVGARGLYAARKLGIPSVAVYQTDMAAYATRHSGVAANPAAAACWAWIRRIHGWADLTLAPSQAALNDLNANGVDRLAWWGRGLDLRLFHPGWRVDRGARRLKQRLAPGGEVVVGYVGRLAPEKEISRLIPLQDMPGVRFVIVGDGPTAAQAREELPHATFLGARSGDDLARAYAAMDVFVHTGTHETFGQTLQEAAAMSLPVVAPAAGGPLDLVRHEETGLLFDPADPADLRRCVECLTLAPNAAELRDRWGAAGLDSVRGRSWDVLTEHLVGHYEATIADRRGLLTTPLEHKVGTSDIPDGTVHDIRSSVRL